VIGVRVLGMIQSVVLRMQIGEKPCNACVSRMKFNAEAAVASSRRNSAGSWTACSNLQGQLQLSHYSRKDFHQELVAPTAAAAFHDDAVLARMLLEQRQREAVEPGKVLAHMRIPNA
jgi:hypothetical protein